MNKKNRQRHLLLKNQAKDQNLKNQQKIKLMAKKIMLKVATGDPVKGGTSEEKMILSPTRSKAALDFDIRDRLSELVGKGNGLLPDDKIAIYKNLATTLGDEKARKVMDHAFLFNQRPDIQGLPVEEKIRAFYNVGSNDPEVGGLIARSKSLGYGALAGFRSSSSNLNQQLVGRAPVVTASAAPEIKKRVMLKVTK
jgi:hypothetical protein